MPNPLPNRWYWHTTHDCPVYVREITNGLACYDLLIVNGEWSSVARLWCETSELDPWPLRGLDSESLMERSESDEIIR